MNYQANPYVNIQSSRTPAATAPKAHIMIHTPTVMEDLTLKDPDMLITDRADSIIDTVGVMGQEVIV